jgi:hypothetical protein
MNAWADVYAEIHGTTSEEAYAAWDEKVKNLWDELRHMGGITAKATTGWERALTWEKTWNTIQEAIWEETQKAFAQEREAYIEQIRQLGGTPPVQPVLPPTHSR